ncbi:MAG: aminodeoxychorismate synthase component I [Methylicorpusculum sp.]|uniref:aminodeoxychorismate synthase component I n=1 Tax=Methylicorpusculum sp. TaxID=2713644 RepID=UPI002724D657|nr:aminodeoxychorismate synthase component I [Methylicorpusculum sp.]MDO8846326.1 aminodeoxychorismate synthase component I [Methylicorpusculum sp.]MDO8938245.1 aminodeoxychorismate synthase component I [Methylicorpusculum sp.]MDO9242032.1 aminodeoxychorismate synthase component I [Methylicorpusculum sp.]MDP2177042.1 aminodeoxychorismate synthase component I [Methylicorpusculum sp.]MDP2203728.1 aminodeoxychorismate synthase component I [Methylicorpusculum sp.]
MSSPIKTVQPLPYFEDSAQLFEPLSGQPWAVFLDSGFPSVQQGRFDIIAAEPVCTLMTHGLITAIERDGETVFSDEDPFELVKQALTLDWPALPDIPFNGGAIGYFAYDLARRLEKLPQISADEEHLAEMAVGIYLWAVVVDHEKKQSQLIGYLTEKQREDLVGRFSRLPEASPEKQFEVTGPVAFNMNKADYEKAFNRIKHYLKEGDCYQVNLSQRFCAPCRGESWTAYLKLRELNAAPFSCFMKTPEATVLSSSPERFLKVHERLVETKPIKGTRPRRAIIKEDQEQAALLENSDKDRAENVMIVDLLRNDISKTCKNGSVKVPKLFAIESYATVHHLVSTVTGELADGKHALDLLKSCFPGGSITGAPKIRAMEVIEELEPNRRGIYCGAIGYIGFDGNMDTNIVIRTLIESADTIRFWAGGGIVNDSEMAAEYQECFDKASALLNVLQQMQPA